MYPIHNHSHFSALDGYGTPEEIAARLKSIGLPGAAITDHGTVAGWNAFKKVMDSEGLQPIFGMEAYQAKGSRLENPGGQKRDSAHVILIAKNLDGYKNIKRISNEAHRSGFYYAPRADWELLERFREGVVCTSACMGSLLSQALLNEESTYKLLNEYLRIFGDDFYIELHTYSTPQQHKLNKHLVSIAQERGIPLLVANDAHYPSLDEYVYHETLLAIQYGEKLDEENPHHPPDLYIMSEAEVRESLSYLADKYVDEAIANTDILAAECVYDLPKRTMHLPKATVPDKDGDYTSEEYLIDLVEQGIRQKYPQQTQEVWDRAEFELDAIIDAGLADYFLIVRDFVSWSRNSGILVGPGRGSVGGSILAYAIDITDVDPLRYGLFFERFWNPGRTKGFPDIDIDLEDVRRDEVKQYLAEKYGENRVISIGTYQTVGPKGGIRDVMRAMYGEETSYKDLKVISDIIDTATRAGIPATWEELWQKLDSQLRPWVKKYPEVFEIAEDLSGRIRNYSTHASAVVISDVDLEDELPGRSDRKEKTFVTQVDMEEVEEMGFLKMDLLGLRNLTTLHETAILAGQPDFDFRDVHRKFLDEMPEEVWQFLDHGQTLGLFQIEDGQGAKGIARALHARTVEDLGLAVALNRPGALESGATERFLGRRNGKLLLKYPHEVLEPILEGTLGEIIYQEAVLAYLKEIGYTLGEADEVRKMMGKKKVKDMEAEFPRYLSRATQYMTEKQAGTIWGLIENFSRYGFNKSHAIGYGLILLWTMYAKWRWLTEFILSSIQSVKKERVGAYIQEARNLGVDVLPPDVNNSEVEITKKDGKIYYGLSNVKGVGSAAAAWIVSNRPYESKQDLVDRLDSQNAEWKDKGSYGLSPKTMLKSNAIDALWNAGAFDTIEEREVEIVDRLKYEEELLGVVITDVVTPVVERNWDAIQDCLTIDEFDESEEEFGTIVGVVSGVRETKVRADARKNAGMPMGFVTLEWEGSEITMVAFPQEYANARHVLRNRLVGKFDLKRGSKEPQLMKAHRFV